MRLFVVTAWLAVQGTVASGEDIAIYQAIRDEMLELADRTHVNATAIACIFTALGEPDEAVTWLDRAIDQREPIVTTLAHWPVFDGVRAHLRYPALLARMGLVSAR